MDQQPTFDRSEELDIAYWQLQYSRVAQHENGRYQVSAFVTAGSLVAAGLIFTRDVTTPQVVIAASAILLVNLFTIVYIAEERAWVKIHQARAADVLERIAPHLVEMQKTVSTHHGRAGTSWERNEFWRSANTLSFIHLTIIVAAVALALSTV